VSEAPSSRGGIVQGYLPDVNTYAVRVFSREDATLGGAEYRSATPPSPGDEIDVRMLHGHPQAYGAVPLANVRVVSVDDHRGVIEAHLIA